MQKMPNFAARFADRLAGTKPPAIAEVGRRARALKAEGRRIIFLNIGEPDASTPEIICRAAANAALRGETHYPPQDGLPALKEAVAEKYLAEQGLVYQKNEILITNGGKQAIYNAVTATVNPGDEVIILRPYWVSYENIVHQAGGVCVFVDCPAGKDFRPDLKALRAAVTERTKWVFLNFPNNPTGTALSLAELKEIAALLRDFPHVRILSDEVYEKLLYTAEQFTSFSKAAPDLQERTLIVNSFSKSYAMTGWRVGFALGHKDLIEAMYRIQSESTSGVCTPAQAAAVSALQEAGDFPALQLKIYRHRRDTFYEKLTAIPGMNCHKPEGGFYFFPSVRAFLGKKTKAGVLLQNDRDFAARLLEEAGVAAVFGEAFGQSGHIRLSYAAEESELIAGLTALNDFCTSLV